MKLLTPVQVKEQKAREQQLEIIRAQEYQKVADKSRRNLADAEASFNLMLATHRTRWATEESDHAKRMVEMTKEVEMLENRKIKALEPVLERENRAVEALEEAKEHIATLKLKEADNDDLKERLEDKLDEVGQREQDVLLWETRIKMQNETLKRREEYIAEQNKRLVDEMTKTVERKAEIEKELRQHENNLVMQEQTLKAWMNRLQVTERNLDARLKRILDREGVLKRNFERLSPYMKMEKKRKV